MLDLRADQVVITPATIAPSTDRAADTMVTKSIDELPGAEGWPCDSVPGLARHAKPGTQSDNIIAQGDLVHNGHPPQWTGTGEPTRFIARRHCQTATCGVSWFRAEPRLAPGTRMSTSRCTVFWTWSV
ncbi:hypothetical protein GCM10009679_42210 [Saccharothrix algeriensis]|uniref:Uncharacterized protein n=1 Tax=Catellatospora bangladeshensis TaxID=310355 RepID=A0A8J3NJC4_9ACTN|nr:hypothetical protein Cba03nite_46840 [Catellatospora bangladeshensis]